MSLADFQEAFAAQLLNSRYNSRDAATLPYLSDDETGRLQFEATRQLTAEALIEQLRTIYPTVLQILGEEDFQAAALAYFERHPPQSPHPVEAVEMFAYFLESLPQAKAFSFLPDVATVDLGYQKSFHAINVKTVRTNIFTELSPEELAAKRMQLHPACFWFSSSYAIYDIWRIHHAPTPPKNVDYHWPQEVIIARPQTTVEIHKIDSGFANALDRLDAGETLQSAFMRANQIDKNFKAVAAIQFMIQNNLIVNLY